MRRVLALGFVMAALGAAGYACSNDTFGADDASADSSVDAQAQFCAAEQQYITTCGYDASCVTANLKQCGAVFASINPSVAAAYVTCINQGQLPCGVDFFAAITSSSCMETQLQNFANDSGAFAQLGQDYCASCFPTQQTQCRAGFGGEKDPGFVAALLSEATIKAIDTMCPKKDAGSAVNADAGQCATDFLVCEFYVAGTQGPPDLCANDAGVD